MNYRKYVFVALSSVLAVPAVAQKSGMNATVTLGVVQQAERVTLQSTGGGKGAVVGGTLGAGLTGRLVAGIELQQQHAERDGAERADDDE